MMEIVLNPIGFARSSRTEAIDDNWDSIISYIELVDDFSGDSFLGLQDFSHVEVLYFFNKVSESKIIAGAEHPRENPEWPKVGIFAQRKKARPNRLGATISKIIRIEGRKLFLSSFDGIDGTPVVDIKPVMIEYLPREEIRQPNWSKELMKGYW
ncbi:MAG: SAM-dependent methyltransferase [Spirochaetia bacterium]|nr:SAM-dependent methyltransferase [Spirochaetia bacterium]